MKFMVIANSAAAKGRSRLLIPQVAARLRAYELDFDLISTERPWHACELACSAALDKYDVVVAAGGDGTCNEVLNGLMQASDAGAGRPCMGVICIGRGNDFAYGAGIPTGWEDGCLALARGSRQSIDVGRVVVDCSTGGGQPVQKVRYFGNGIGIGFDAVVNVQAAQTRLNGFLGYTVAALRTLLDVYHPPYVHIDCDEDVLAQAVMIVSVMNGRRMGGGFLMTPDADSKDGVLDLCVAREVSRATILAMLPLFMRGSQGIHPAVRFMRSRRVTVAALNGSLPMHVDGETLCLNAERVVVEVLPGVLDVLGSKRS